MKWTGQQTQPYQLSHRVELLGKGALQLHKTFLKRDTFSHGAEVDVLICTRPSVFPPAIFICDPLSENPAPSANIEFELETILSVQVVFQLNSDYCTKVVGGVGLYHTEL